MADTANSLDAVRLLCDRAEVLIDVGRDAEAIPLLHQSLARDPQNVRAFCLLSGALISLGQYQPAMQAAQMAAHYDPSEEWGYRLYSIALRNLGWRTQALDAARYAASLAPSMPAAIENLAICQKAAGKRKEAWETAIRLQRLAPETAEPCLILGSLSLSRRKWCTAEGWFREALRLDPQSWIAMNNLGLSLEHQRHMDEAIDCYHAAARLSPNEQLARANLRLTLGRYLLDWVTGIRGLGRVLRVWFPVLIVAMAAAEILRHACPFVPSLGIVFNLVNLSFASGYLAALTLRAARIRRLPPELCVYYDDVRIRERRAWLLQLPILETGVLLALAVIGGVIKEGLRFFDLRTGMGSYLFLASLLAVGAEFYVKRRIAGRE